MSTINVSKTALFQISNLRSEMKKRLPITMMNPTSNMLNVTVPKMRTATPRERPLLDYPTMIAKYITLVKICQICLSAFQFPFLFVESLGMEPRNKLCAGLRVLLCNHLRRRPYHNDPNLLNTLHNTRSSVRYLHKVTPISSQLTLLPMIMLIHMITNKTQMRDSLRLECTQTISRVTEKNQPRLTFILIISRALDPMHPSLQRLALKQPPLRHPHSYRASTAVPRTFLTDPYELQDPLTLTLSTTCDEIDKCKHQASASTRTGSTNRAFMTKSLDSGRFSPRITRAISPTPPSLLRRPHFSLIFTIIGRTCIRIG